MTIAIDNLPNDVKLLKQFIVEREEQLLSEREELIARIRDEAARQL